MLKNCLQCGIDFEDKTSNLNKICCSKVCVNKLWYLRKTGKTAEEIQPKNTFESYQRIVLDLGLIFLRIEKNTKQPRMVVKCKEGHEWSSSITNLQKTNGGCQKCYGLANRLSLREVIEIASIRGFELMSDTFSSGFEKALFICQKCQYNWSVSPSNFKRHQCPGCRPGIESKVREIFESLTGKKFPSVRPQWLKNPDSKSNGLLQLDGYCEELKLAFEYDGEFHYVPYWGTNTTSSLKATQLRDKVKDTLCEAFGVSLIRIPYTEKKNLENFIKSNLLQVGILNVKV
jgi:hypothetical protein